MLGHVAHELTAYKLPGNGLTTLDYSRYRDELDWENTRLILRVPTHGNNVVTRLMLKINHPHTERNLVDLRQALTHGNCQVEELNLSDSNLGYLGAKTIAECLAHPTTTTTRITKLVLHNCMISDGGCELLASCLANAHNRVEYLSLAENSLFDGVSAIARALTQKECNLRTLDLSGCSFSQDTLRLLANSMTEESSCGLVSLSLNETGLTATAARSLLQALVCPHSKLEVLSLRANLLSDVGAMTIAQALKHANCKIRELDLSFNGIGEEGTIEFAKALTHHNNRVQVFSLDGNDHGPEGIRLLALAIRSPHNKLQSLTLNEDAFEAGDDDDEDDDNVLMMRTTIYMSVQSHHCKLVDLNVSSRDSWAEFALAAAREKRAALALLSARYVRRERTAAAPACAIRRLPVELIRMVSDLLRGSHVETHLATVDAQNQLEEEEEEEDEGW